MIEIVLDDSVGFRWRGKSNCEHNGNNSDFEPNSGFYVILQRVGDVVLCKTPKHAKKKVKRKSLNPRENQRGLRASNSFRNLSRGTCVFFDVCTSVVVLSYSDRIFLSRHFLFGIFLLYFVFFPFCILSIQIPRR